MHHLTFYRSALMPPDDYSSSELNASMQIYHFKPLTGDIAQHIDGVYSTYIEHGIPVRVALRQQVPVVSFASFNRLAKQLTLAPATEPSDLVPAER